MKTNKTMIFAVALAFASAFQPVMSAGVKDTVVNFFGSAKTKVQNLWAKPVTKVAVGSLVGGLTYKYLPARHYRTAGKIGAGVGALALVYFGGRALLNSIKDAALKHSAPVLELD